ncbi:50S ribosomal protein L24 [Lachnospiraceae bacterium WCA-9-b2]|jgi:large subunit ribosomal protein L24|uniref:Large ribosomal subunit protein uL24 n=1 Tax=Sporofaciens musculi TaxID=2681861 RepID=A0A7X3SI11_9FIRM|nr:50S ribosomal protein L24 [Sporofaciens musculi]MCI8784976.1 50S ribosomal protein L24 [Dorea sp.]MXP74953.1 50S ribosomal protein L24 [Sporofaciens musculi]
MSMLKIKKGDTVKVIAGSQKDKEGKVIAVNQKDGKVVVEGVNMLTKHTKPSAANQNGGIIHQEGPINISNVMYVHKGKPTRVGIKMDGDKKVRYAKSTGEVID